MILIGIDDTDIVGSRGTNQLAREIVRTISADWQCLWIVRHQLLSDPRVPFTSKNGSASIALALRNSVAAPESAALSPGPVEVPDEVVSRLVDSCRQVMREDFIEGSDPGLCCLPGPCPQAVIDWGDRCQRDFVTKADAMRIALESGIHLEALGGTEDGVIGALAAVGLASQKNDGRIVQWREWPDDLSFHQPVRTVLDRDIQVRDRDTDREIKDGIVNVGKHLRPNLRNGEAVLFVETDGPANYSNYRALKLL